MGHPGMRELDKIDRHSNSSHSCPFLLLNYSLFLCLFFFLLLYCEEARGLLYAKQAFSHLDTPSAGLLFFTSYHTRLCFLVEQSGLRSICFQTQWTGRAALASLLPCCTLPRVSVKMSFLCFPMFSPHFACLRQVKRRTKIIIWFSKNTLIYSLKRLTAFTWIIQIMVLILFYSEGEEISDATWDI